MKFRHMSVIEAVQFTGENYNELRTFAGISAHAALVFPTDLSATYVRHPQPGDWLVKNSVGNLCLVRTEVFAKDYIAIAETR